MRTRAARSPRLGRSDGPLATVLASGAMARVVTHFVLHPRSALHFQALRRVTGLSTRSLQHEVSRLEGLGLIRPEPDGRLIRYRAPTDHPGWQVFRSAVREFADPAEVLRIALAQVPGVDAAFVYGSFARKTDVHPGSDVDVFVVGEALDQEPTRLALAEEMLEASGALGREVNASRYTWDKLARRLSEGGRFIRAVLAGPKDWVRGDESVLAPAHRPTRSAPRGRRRTMSREDIDRLVAERSLVRKAFDDADVAGFWAKAVASYTDARRGGISADSRFLLAYTACLQVTFAVLAASGLRVKSTASHYTAFYAMQKLDDPVLRPFAIRFDELRVTRHESIYEPEHREGEVKARLEETLGVLAKALPAIREWVSGRRPSLEGRLAPMPP